MKKFKDYLENYKDATDKGLMKRNLSGLYNAKVGDILLIGVEGQNFKERSTIKNIASNGKITDREGNIYNASGKIYRRKKNSGKPDDKIIYAKHMTEKQMNKEIREHKIIFLKTIKWEKLTDTELEKVLEIFNYRNT